MINLLKAIKERQVKLVPQFDPENCWGESYLYINIEGGEFDGWKIVYFEDCGDMDYVEWVEDGTGKKVEDYYSMQRQFRFEGDKARLIVFLENVVHDHLFPEQALKDLAFEEYRKRWQRGEIPPPPPLSETIAKMFFETTPFYSYLRSKGYIEAEN